MVALDLAAIGPRFEKSGESPGNEEPCWLFRRAGFSKIGDLWSDRELPACLLGEVFACEARLRISDAGAGPHTGFADTQEHTRATQPRGRLRMYWICPD